ncbi:MAG: hypothetical protein JW871_01010 [Endomicrobiales bacterium]|nr:hypothetical protein [Endomicrobiales bacterium]
MLKKFLPFLLVFIFLIISSSVFVSSLFTYPFPSVKMSPVKQYIMFDMACVVAGVRRLAADIAWVQLMHYYASPGDPFKEKDEYDRSWNLIKSYLGFKIEDDHHHGHYCPYCGKYHGTDEEAEEHEHKHEEEHAHKHAEKGKRNPELLAYCYRALQLDPFFYYIYLYGAGALAWNEDRPEEAIELLNHGIQTMENYRSNITKDSSQPFWQFHLYSSAIIYRKSGDFGKMISNLELAAQQQNCPNLVKAILANIYSRRGENAKALKLWIEIYDSSDPTYRVKAEDKITELRKLLNL